MTDKENNDEIKEEPFHDQGGFDPDLKSKIVVNGHDWKQMGFDIVCFSCPMTHGTHIGSNKMLVGIDKDGMPRFAVRN